MTPQDKIILEIQKSNREKLLFLRPEDIAYKIYKTWNVVQMRDCLITRIRNSDLFMREIAEALYSYDGSDDEELREIWNPQINPEEN